MEANYRYIGKISRVVDMYTNIKLKNSNYNNTEITVLHIIRHNEGLNQEEISKKIMMDKAIVHRMLVKFEKNGLITRDVDELDKRNKKIFSTKKLQEMKMEKISYEDEFYNHIFKDINSADLEVFNKVLEEVYVKSKLERKNKFHDLI